MNIIKKIKSLFKKKNKVYRQNTANRLLDFYRRRIKEISYKK